MQVILAEYIVRREHLPLTMTGTLATQEQLQEQPLHYLANRQLHILLH